METVQVNKFRVYPCAFWKGLTRRADAHQGLTPSGYDKNTWPPRTSIWCWQCCHPFETVPAFLPVHLNLETNMFYFAGNFCSWNCVKVYTFRMEKHRRTDAVSWISLLAFLTAHRPRHCLQDASEPHHYTCPCVDQFKGVDIPLPKEQLHMFGGTIAIKEYRHSLLTIDKYEWVTTYFHTNPSIKQDMDRLTSTQKRRAYAFCLVSYPGPSESTTDQIYVLPLTHKTIPKPQPEQTQAQEQATIKPYGRSTSRRKIPKGSSVVALGLSTSTSTSTSTTTSTTMSATTSATMSATGPDPKTAATKVARMSSTFVQPHMEIENVLHRDVEPVVSEEQAFYVQSMNKYGNLFTSMGISIEKIPSTQKLESRKRK